MSGTGSEGGLQYWDPLLALNPYPDLPVDELVVEKAETVKQQQVVGLPTRRVDSATAPPAKKVFRPTYSIVLTVSIYRFRCSLKSGKSVLKR